MKFSISPSPNVLPLSTINRSAKLGVALTFALLSVSIPVASATEPVAASPTFSVSTVGSMTTLTISDSTSGASIYYAPGGRTPNSDSIQYTGPIAITLPIAIEAIAVAPGYSNSAIVTAAYSALFTTNTVVTTSLTPSVLGQSVTFTATVTPTSGTFVPTGSVLFSVYGVAIGAPVQLNANGAATYTTSLLPEGTLSIAATYTPSSGASFLASTSSALTQNVYTSARQSNSVWFNNSSRPLGSGFNYPYGVAVDTNDNVFVADAGSNAIKEITAASGYSTVNTLNSSFNYPTGIAVDASDNLFVADAANNAIYKLSQSSNYAAATSLGYGFSWPYSVAIDASDNVFVADLGHGAIKEITVASNYATVNTLNNEFTYPWGIAVDVNGNLFVTDVASQTVNELTATSSFSTVNTLDRSYFGSPYGIAIDANDNLYVNDLSLNSVREISLSDGWTTVCTPGSGLKTPIGIAVDASGNLFAADTAHNAVKEISWLGGNFGTTAVGTTSPFTISMYFFIDQATTFGSILIQTQGTSKNDFTDAGTGNCWTSTPYASGSECTVAVNFTPTQTGSRSGTVSLLDPSGNLLATAVLQGIGQ